jgi:ribosome biogenesis SPOUT family RNA methylase Rps3
MSTDNAVYVVKQIAEGKKLSDLSFQDEVEIKTGKKDSIILPYRYAVVNGKPLISKKVVEYLKNKKEF